MLFIHKSFKYGSTWRKLIGEVIALISLSVYKNKATTRKQIRMMMSSKAAICVKTEGKHFSVQE